MARLAERQFGRISWRQMRELGIARQTIHRWHGQGYLHRVLPRVYAVGHRASTTEADLAAALLYAGPGAMLSHATAAWWLGLADARPRLIEITSPRRCHSPEGMTVHSRPQPERVWHKRLPVTPLAQTLLDLATVAPPAKLRRALAQADFQGMLDLASIERELGRGRPGTAALRRALGHHLPQLALTRSGLEDEFLQLCHSEGIPLPEVNVRVAGWTVDFFWPRERIVVELDGYANHRSPAQLDRDRRLEMDVRAAGCTLLRYGARQFHRQRTAVIDELVRTRAGRTPEPLPRARAG